MSEVEEKIREAARALWNNELHQSSYRNKVEAMETVLSMEPPEEWLKSLVGGIKYLPIERIEWLLSTIYGRFGYEIRSSVGGDKGANVAVRVRVFNPVFEEWEVVDGVGAAPLETSHGDMALALALPAAKTFAVKDAVEPLGKIFGKDLNRPDSIAYEKPAEDYTKKFIPLMQKYKGADKAELKDKMMKAVSKGWSAELVKELSEKLGA